MAQTIKYISRSYTGTPVEVMAARMRDRVRLAEDRAALEGCTPEEIRVLAEVQQNRTRWDDTERRMQAVRYAQEHGNSDLAKIAWNREQEAYQARWNDNR